MINKNIVSVLWKKKNNNRIHFSIPLGCNKFFIIPLFATNILNDWNVKSQSIVSETIGTFSFIGEMYSSQELEERFERVDFSCDCVDKCMKSEV